MNHILLTAKNSVDSIFDTMQFIVLFKVFLPKKDNKTKLEVTTFILTFRCRYGYNGHEKNTA